MLPPAPASMASFEFIVQGGWELRGLRPPLKVTVATSISTARTASIMTERTGTAVDLGPAPARIQVDYRRHDIPDRGCTHHE